jgi:hypothetical protein
MHPGFAALIVAAAVAVLAALHVVLQGRPAHPAD